MQVVNVKAYPLADRILVKYFDNGEGEHLCCPSCGWLGRVEDCNNERSLDSLKLSCPNCEINLGLIDPDNEKEEDKIAA